MLPSTGLCPQEVADQQRIRSVGKPSAATVRPNMQRVMKVFRPAPEVQAAVPRQPARQQGFPPPSAGRYPRRSARDQADSGDCQSRTRGKGRRSLGPSHQRPDRQNIQRSNAAGFARQRPRECLSWEYDHRVRGILLCTCRHASSHRQAAPESQKSAPLSPPEPDCCSTHFRRPSALIKTRPPTRKAGKSARCVSRAATGRETPSTLAVSVILRVSFFKHSSIIGRLPPQSVRQGRQVHGRFSQLFQGDKFRAVRLC